MKTQVEVDWNEKVHHFLTGMKLAWWIKNNGLEPYQPDGSRTDIYRSVRDHTALFVFFRRDEKALPRSVRRAAASRWKNLPYKGIVLVQVSVTLDRTKPLRVINLCEPLPTKKSWASRRDSFYNALGWFREKVFSLKMVATVTVIALAALSAFLYSGYTKANTKAEALQSIVKNAAEQCDETKKDLDAKMIEVAVLVSEKRILESQITTLSAATQKSGDNDKSIVDLQASKTKLNEVNAKLTEVNTELATSQDSLAKSQTKYDVLSAQLVAATQKSVEDGKRFAANIQKLSYDDAAKLKAINVDVAELVKKNEALQKTIDGYKATLATATTEANDLEKLKSNLATAVTEKNAAMAEIHKALGMMGEAVQQKNLAEAKLKQLVDSQGSVSLVVQDLNDKIVELKKQLTIATSQPATKPDDGVIAKLQSELKATQAKLTSAEGESKRLGDELAKANTVATELSAKIADAQSKFQNLNAAIALKDEALVVVNEKVRTVTSERDGANKLLVSANAELESSKHQIAEMVETVAALQSQMSLVNEKDSLEHDRLVQQLEYLRAEITVNGLTANFMQNSYDQLLAKTKQDKTDADVALAKLVADLAGAKAELAEANSQVSLLTKTLGDSKGAEKSALDELNQAKTKVESLSALVDEQASALEAVKSQLVRVQNTLPAAPTTSVAVTDEPVLRVRQLPAGVASSGQPVADGYIRFTFTASGSK